MATKLWTFYLSSPGVDMPGPFQADFLGEVPDADVRYHDGCRKHVRVYRLRVRGRDGEEIEVHRRYSQFRQLVASMPKLGWDVVPPQSFWRLAFSKRFRERRAQQLAKLVAYALALDPLATSPVLRRFLGLGSAGRGVLETPRGALNCIQEESSDEDDVSTDAPSDSDDVPCGARG